MKNWYLSKNGQALGPLDEEKIISLIEAGDINHLDLVYQAGDNQWKPLSEVPGFAKHLNSQETENAESRQEDEGTREWVLLKKVKTEKGKEYKQLGPYTQQQVMDLLDTGKIRFSDFGWKKGHKNWMRISELEPFSDPLPSSPNIDASLYTKTQPDIDVQTMTDAEKKASLTNMVKIERFDHEKTRVVRRDKKEEPAPENDFDEDDEDFLTASAPINNEDFVTESHAGLPEESQSDDVGVNLWSLEPPDQAKKKEDSKAAVSAKPKKTAKNSGAVEKRKKKKKPKSAGSSASSETWQLVAAGGAFLLALFFLYLSFFSSGDDDIAQRPSENKHSPVQAIEPIKRQQQPQASFSQTAQNKKVQSLKLVIKNNKKKVAQVQKSNKRIKPQPKVPLAEKTNPQQKPIKVAKKPHKVRQPSRPVVAKARPQKTLPTASKKVAQKVLPRTTGKSKRVSTAKVQKRKIRSGTKAVGGKKSQSYYKQRDRKALFYSSLKAETLAVQIENQYKKLKENKSAWNRYYRQWRKKVQVSLAKDIRNYPAKNQKYAYPTVLKSFKKDYALFYKYGELFNSKVTGQRVPSGAPKNMRVIFTRYRKQAQSLGR